MVKNDTFGILFVCLVISYFLSCPLAEATRLQERQRELRRREPQQEQA